jgi:hypothetical protein
VACGDNVGAMGAVTAYDSNFNFLNCCGFGVPCAVGGSKPEHCNSLIISGGGSSISAFIISMNILVVGFLKYKVYSRQAINIIRQIVISIL